MSSTTNESAAETGDTSHGVPIIPRHLSIQHLISLPSTQHHQLTHLQSQLLDLSTTHIASLMRSLEFPTTVRNNLGRHLSNVATDVLTLCAECRSELNHKPAPSTPSSFTASSHETHHLNTLLLNHTDSIEAIMQIPSLMQSCLVQDMYTEVLDLHHYLNTLTTKYANSIPILHTLHAQSRRIMATLMRKIVHQLRMTKLSVPHCLRLLTILKRLDLCNERELRILFLQNRLKHLRDMYRQEHAKFLSVPNMHMLEKETLSNFIFNYLLDLTRSLKASIFPVITQYRAMFHDSNHMDDQIILTSCIYYHVTLPYVNVIKSQLKHVSSAEQLAKLADECHYTSQTLAKIGADLRHLLQHDFLTAMRTHIDSLLDAALHEFVQNLHSFNWLPTDTAYATISQTQKELLTYRPLSIFANSLLSALNELREFPIVQLCAHAIGKLEDIFRAALAQCDTIKSRYPFDDNERQQFSHFVRVLGKVLPEYMMDGLLVNIYDAQQQIEINHRENLLKVCSNETKRIQEF
mmetsp:Transcript_6039/g.22842  ORF Transcript_6039/g.22842 Transcript_6039/m.22842 type:complete len:521 (-) Transcript_6039:53-1615(-)